MAMLDQVEEFLSQFLRSSGSGGTGGFAVSPGFVANMLPALQRLDAYKRFSPIIAGLMSGGGGGGGSVADPTQDILNASLADLSSQEGLKTRDLQNRFSSMGRSLSSTAFGDAASRLAEAFSRARLTANAQARTTGAGIMRGQEQVQNQRLQLLMSLL